MYVVIGLVILLLIGLYFYIQNYLHKVTSYKIFIPNLHPSIKEKKVVFISDTHFRERISHSFMDRVLIEIENIKPDLILFGGDIVHSSVTEDIVVEHTKDFFFQLGKLAPTYVVYGNHDTGSNRIKEITEILKRVDVHLLDNEAKWISFDEPGAGFWLMGLNEYSSLSIKEDPLSKIDLPKDSKNEPKILLAHYPHFFEKYLKNDNKRADLILSGHTHGGQAILPYVGGLYAPGQGLNPYFDYGIFTSQKYPENRLIISRGLGNSGFPFRFNNRPEIITIEFE